MCFHPNYFNLGKPTIAISNTERCNFLNQIRGDTRRYAVTVGGGIGIVGFTDLANFWSGLLVFALLNCGLSVLVSCAVCGFSPV